MESPRYSCGPFLHLNVIAVLCHSRRAALASSPSLCLLQGEQLCDSRRLPRRLGPRQRTVPCKGKPQVRQRIRKQQHSHPSSAFFSDSLIRTTGRRGAQNNRVLRVMLAAKDTVINKSSSLYQNRQTKTLEKLGGKELRKLCCHTSIKLHLLAKHLKGSINFFLVRFGFGHTQDQVTGTIF